MKKTKLLLMLGTVRLAMVFGITLLTVFSGLSVLDGGGGISLNPRAYQPAVYVVGLTAPPLSTLVGNRVCLVFAVLELRDENRVMRVIHPSVQLV